MKTWNERTHFAALDWADDHHDLVVVDSQGQIVLELTFDHNATGWQQAQEALARWPELPVAIETSAGPAVDQLLQRGLAVYPVMPKAAARYRERKRPTGSKDDRHDAWSLADALRTDGQAWSVLSPLDPLTAELRALCRDEIALIEQRTALVNQLLAALKEYYPAAVAAFDDWTAPYTWAFVLAFPTPAELAGAGKRKWEKFLHTHKLWRPQTAAQRLEIFARATEFGGSAAITAAKSLLAQSLCRLLQTLEQQLTAYRKRIQALFDQHPDHDLFGSLPGAGAKTGPPVAGRTGRSRLDPDQPGAGACGHRAGHLREWQDPAGENPARLRPLAAGDAASLGGLKPAIQRLGGGLLSGPSG